MKYTEIVVDSNYFRDILLLRYILMGINQEPNAIDDWNITKKFWEEYESMHEIHWADRICDRKKLEQKYQESGRVYL